MLKQVDMLTLEAACFIVNQYRPRLIVVDE